MFTGDGPKATTDDAFSFHSLSGNPPFYDETEEENTDLHNRIIFCRIVAGDFEFDSPYWDDISPAGTRLGQTDRHRLMGNDDKVVYGPLSLPIIDRFPPCFFFLSAKELVCRLMEVDQMLRITAQDALWHEW